MRSFATLVAWMGMMVAGAASAAYGLPDRVRVGEHSLQPVSCGVRDTLWVEHYVAALYLPRRGGVLEALRDPATAKALYVRILDDDHLPEELPREWHAPMARYLDAAGMARGREAYRALARGDTLLVTYEQGRGVRLIVNGRLQAATPGHGLIEAVLRTWADGEPLSEKLDRAVDDHRCPAR